jgi:ATP-dependent DNA ligase
MPLIRVKQPFDHPDWLFELKHDGFRALAIIEGHGCSLVSRRGYVFKQWPQLVEELAHTVRARHAVLDGEVVVLRRDGSSDFNSLLFRREWPYYYASTCSSSTAQISAVSRSSSGSAGSGS